MAEQFEEFDDFKVAKDVPELENAVKYRYSLLHQGYNVIRNRYFLRCRWFKPWC